jgi:DNA polymerase III alpha subunit
MYKFPCGCSFPITNEDLKESDGLPSLEIDYYNLRDCSGVWELIDSGKTKGIFQLEKQLGQEWAKKVVPQSIDELSALISIIRPGTLQSMVNGKSMTACFADRKAAKEEVVYFYDVLEPILRETYGILVYQEQSIRIAKELYGFSLIEADQLRKAMGKKDAKLMAETETLAFQKAKEAGIIDEEASKQIFSWIRESNRYAFNKSHGVGYAILGYWSAYVKHHFPLHFYTSWIHFSKDKMKPQEEMAELINDAKYFDTAINVPSLLNLYHGDRGQTVLHKNQVFLGISDIKRVGLSQVDKLWQLFDSLHKDPKDLDWTGFLEVSDHITSTTVNGMIAAGALGHFGLQRTRMTFEYDLWSQLTKTEKAKTKALGITGLEATLKAVYDGYKDTNRRKEKLRSMIEVFENPTYSMNDSVAVLANLEQEYLGLPITCSRLDACINAVGDTTCKEFANGKTGKMTLAVEITRVKENIIRNGKTAGQTMAFLTVTDHTCPINNVVLFAAPYNAFKHLLYEGNTVIIEGKPSDRGSFTVDKVRQI